MENILAIYKPYGPTSHDIIDEIRKITGVKKVGHAGTLDPLATGVLVVGIGRDATKQLNNSVQKEKEYIAKIFLGQESTTDDAEGDKKTWKINNIPNVADVEKSIKKYIGKIKQIPPQFSAIKIKGKTAYSSARQGKKVDLTAREVEIKNIEIIEYSFPYLILKVTTGPGVYIRALARDIGTTLKTGGYLSGLERTRVGEFTIEESLTLENFIKVWRKNI